MAASKVSEKSTKGEIWDAYTKLLVDLKDRPVVTSDDPVKLQKMAAALTEAKAALMGHFEATIERVGGVQQAYQDADQALTQRKNQTVDSLEQSKRELHEAIQTVRKQWEQEKADYELARKRENEAYDYDLSRKRRDAEEAYAQKSREREEAYARKSREREEAYSQKTRENDAALATRETAVAEREQLVTGLQKQADDFPAQLEQAVKVAREELARELKTASDYTLKEAKQTAEHEKSILALRLQSSEATITGQTKQITDLQRQLDASAAQLKEMAVTVIQSNSPPQPPVVAQ